MNIAPDPEHIGAVRGRMAVVAHSKAASRRRARNAWIAVLLLGGACGTGLAATEAGRSLVRWILTPVLPRHEVTATTPDGTVWTQGGGTEPAGPEQQRAAADLFDEIFELSRAGRGVLVGLLERPRGTAYSIRYTFEDGSWTTVATGTLTDAQARAMRVDEIQRLRDAGAGTLIVQSPSPYGLGYHMIRFALPGRTVDLETWYPPGPRAEREAIFAETRLLKAARLFTVEQASISVENPGAGVMGTLRYTLADGRTVGIVERIPDELITPDGAYVRVPGTGEAVTIGSDGTWRAPDGSLWVTSGGAEPASPEEHRQTVDRLGELHALKEAGGGQLIALCEGPGWAGELSTTAYRVRYTLADGGTTTVGESSLSAAQRATMRVEEIRRLRDEGAGEIIARRESPLGLGGYTIRFTLADGETVDLHTVYPPGTRQERLAIFSEIRALKAQRRFTVREPRVVPPSGVWGLLGYTLADGRSVSHYEQVPTDLITSDGRHVAVPGTGKLIEIAETADD